MYGEPNVYEYAKALEEADKNASTEYCRVSHTNLGWVGLFVYTPHNTYSLVREGYWRDTYYTIHDTGRPGSYGKQLVGIKFSTKEEALAYMEAHNM